MIRVKRPCPNPRPNLPNLIALFVRDTCIDAPASARYLTTKRDPAFPWEIGSCYMHCAPNKMNPFSRALLDFHAGNRESTFTIRRDDGFQQQVPVAPFFETEHYPALEVKALEACYGSVLDIGAAAGRHSLALIRRGLTVTSLDILPEVECIMRDRGLEDVIIADVSQFSGRRFDTLLMLMNGIGMVGSIEGLAGFLQHAHGLIVPGRQIVCDSIDVAVTTDPQHVAYREANLASGRPAGQQAFTMDCAGTESVRFDWLHVDFPTLARLSEETGWQATLLDQEESGHYLCKIVEQPISE